MTQQVLVENLQRAGEAGHRAGAGVLGGIEAVVVEHCPTDFDRPARIQAIAALSHGFFLLTACRFAGNAALISSKTASDSDAALPDAATQAEYRLSRSRAAPQTGRASGRERGCQDGEMR